MNDPIDLGQNASANPDADDTGSSSGSEYPSIYIPAGIDLSSLPDEGTATIKYKKISDDDSAGPDAQDADPNSPDSSSTGTELQIMSISPDEDDGPSQSDADDSASAIESGLSAAGAPPAQ